MKVSKFGGTSVGTVEKMKHVAELICDGTPQIVVLSATAGTTNHLEEISASLFSRDIDRAHDLITRLEFQFIDFANQLLADEYIRHEAVDYILDRFQQLWKFTQNDFTSTEEKEVLAQGELLGTAIHAEEIQIWTDIDGMHNNDPREVVGTRPVKRLSFNEAEQLAFYGAKILHPFCIAPARLKNIPVRLLNSMEPMAEGTLISDLQDEGIIKAIAAKDKVLYVKFESNHSLCPYLFISKIFDTFAKYRTPLCLVVSSNQDVSVAIDDSTHLSEIVAEMGRYARVLVENRMSIVSVVGNMQWQYAGFEAQIMEALREIPLRMISYGSSNSDVAFVIRTENKKRALQALNDRLFQAEYAS